MATIGKVVLRGFGPQTGVRYLPTAGYTLTPTLPAVDDDVYTPQQYSYQRFINFLWLDEVWAPVPVPHASTKLDFDHVRRVQLWV